MPRAKVSIRTLREQLAAMTRERDASTRAKGENDDRFMIERDEARVELRKALLEMDNLRANVLMRRALAKSSARVCFIVAVGCGFQINVIRSETLGWYATLDAARDHVLEWECDWTEAGYYSHLLLFDPGTSEVAWYRSVLPEGWVAGYGSPPVPLAPCDAPEWWNVGNPGETYLVNVLGEIETRTRLRAALERAEANNVALAARLRDAQTTALTLALVRAELARTERDTLTATDALHARCDALEAVVAMLPRCYTCDRPATIYGGLREWCDDHRPEWATAGDDLSYAVALRALLKVTRG